MFSSLISISVILKKKRPKLLSCQKYFCGAWGIVRNFIKLLNYQIKAIKYVLLTSSNSELGDYGRAWNSVHLNNYLHIVDLMESPGSVLKDGSADFIDYLEL